MAKGLRSLRSKWTAQSVVVFGLIQILLYSTVMLVLQWTLNLSRETRADVRWLFFSTSLVSLLAAGLASWLLGGRWLETINTVKRQAEAVTPDNLDLRLNVPEKAEKEVMQLVATVNQMLDRLEAAFAAKSSFLTNVAHELKTPLAILLGDAQTLRRRARTPEEYDKFAATVEEEMRRLAKVVDSFLTLAQTRVRVKHPAIASVSANEFVMDALEHCRPLAKQREVRLSPVLALRPDNGDEPLVLGDPQLLEVMIENIVRNAIQHSPVGGEVNVTVQVVEGKLHVAIADRGAGIPPEHLSDVFNEFVSFARKEDWLSGHGIGLAIARSVARLHHGDVTAANRPEGGAEFIVKLPLTTP